MTVIIDVGFVLSRLTLGIDERKMLVLNISFKKNKQFFISHSERNSLVLINHILNAYAQKDKMLITCAYYILFLQHCNYKKPILSYEKYE